MSNPNPDPNPSFAKSSCLVVGGGVPVVFSGERRDRVALVSTSFVTQTREDRGSRTHHRHIELGRVQILLLLLWLMTLTARS